MVEKKSDDPERFLATHLLESLEKNRREDESGTNESLREFLLAASQAVKVATDQVDKRLNAANTLPPTSRTGYLKQLSEIIGEDPRTSADDPRSSSSSAHTLNAIVPKC